MFRQLTLDWTAHALLQLRSKRADAHQAFGSAQEEILVHFDQIHMPNEGHYDRSIPKFLAVAV